MQLKPDMDGDGECEDVSVTPAPKRPRLCDEIARGLQITPPPVVGRQSDTRIGIKNGTLRDLIATT